MGLTSARDEYSRRDDAPIVIDNTQKVVHVEATILDDHDLLCHIDRVRSVHATVMLRSWYMINLNKLSLPRRK